MHKARIQITTYKTITKTQITQTYKQDKWHTTNISCLYTHLNTVPYYTCILHVSFFHGYYQILGRIAITNHTA